MLSSFLLILLCSAQQVCCLGFFCEISRHLTAAGCTFSLCERALLTLFKCNRWSGFSYCTHTGNSRLSWYVVACYYDSPTCENELIQSLHSTKSSNKSVCLCGSCLSKDCSGRNCTVYWETKQNTHLWFSFVTILTWTYWNQQLLAGWFYMLLKLSCSNQHAFHLFHVQESWYLKKNSGISLLLYSDYINLIENQWLANFWG